MLKSDIEYFCAGINHMSFYLRFEKKYNDKKEEADTKNVVHDEKSKGSFLKKLEKAKKERANVEVVTGLTEGKESETLSPATTITTPTSYFAKGKK